MKRLITTVFVMGMFLTTVALADDVDSNLSFLPLEIASNTPIVPAANSLYPTLANSSQIRGKIRAFPSSRTEDWKEGASLPLILMDGRQ